MGVESGDRSRLVSQVLLFIVATACKSFEPIGVDLSKQTSNVTSAQTNATDGKGDSDAKTEFPFSICMLVMIAELSKCVFLIVVRGLQRIICQHYVQSESSTNNASTFSHIRSSATFGLAAIFLAAVNQLMMLGIMLLGPLLYQIVFLATGTICAGLLSELLLGEKLASMQWLSLGGLIVGFCLTLPGFDPLHLTSIFNMLSGEDVPLGLAITSLSGVLFSLQGALFEKASRNKANQSVVLQSLMFAGYGFVANCIWFQMTEDYSTAFRGFNQLYTWVAVSGIVFADISMTFLFKSLGSTTYSFSRAIATCIVGLYEISNGTQKMSLQFGVGSLVVTLAALLYKQSAPNHAK